ncbi:glycosyltransferase family 87 protein [Roseibium porphyridii]|uniref:Glycosyltransferase family 87 protein n=1 Tax=Roseibium porphyridii TaxID=2866279 RepID=A0ABY8F0J9_9HYPH|nr:glycosyltransferase family 87 protein [Roseibium sp. KMA01]WFE88987.1 glycosyltransferase family 87 protein [Roseibium sp. KMA01]
MTAQTEINSELAAADPQNPGLWHRGATRGDWLTWDRIGFACLCSAIGYSLALAWMLLLPNSFGSANGTLLMDYLSFWLAGKQVLSGTPELVYLPKEFAALQESYTGSDTVFGFFYPPTFQLLQSPFALLPYKVAFAAFVGLTTGLLFLACRMITGKWLLAACLILVPACANNAFHGQNAALTAALYAFFLIGIERGKFVWAGVALGLLTIKPQLGILAPVALIASLNWRSFVSASVTTLGLAGLSVAIVGIGVWVVFWQQAPVAAAMMELGGVEWGKMVSTYGSARQLGLGHMGAMSVQAVVGLGVLACVWHAWRKSEDMTVRASVLVGGALLVTPFALSYDFTLLVVPCAFLIRDGLKSGFLPYEKVLLAGVIALSASTSPLALYVGLPVAPLLPLIVLWLGMRRLGNDLETRDVPTDISKVPATVA